MLAQTTSERRKCLRYLATHDIRVRCLASGPILGGSLVDLSYDGCLIDMADALTAGIDEAIELRLRASDLNYRIMGFVRHLSPNRLVAGLEFIPPPGAEAAQFRLLVAGLDHTRALEPGRTADA